MFKKFGLVISTLVGLLMTIASGMQTSAQPADLSVRFGEPNLEGKTSMSENSQSSGEMSVRFGEPNLQDKTSMSENSQSSVEERTRPPRRQESSEPCPACGMG